MYIYKCDKCGITHECTKGQQLCSPKGWFVLVFGSQSYGVQKMSYHLCAKCRVELKIPEDKPEDSIQDRLFEIITEIVADKV